MLLLLLGAAAAAFVVVAVADPETTALPSASSVGSGGLARSSGHRSTTCQGPQSVQGSLHVSSSHMITPNE